MAQAEGIETDLDAVKSELRDAIDDLMELRTGFLEENDAVQLGDRDFNTRKRHLDDDDEYIDALWNDISQVNQVFVPFRDSTLEKWSNKVQAASGMRLNKKFKAFDQNVMTQIGNILSDKESLIKRTQLQRAEYKILGKVTSLSIIWHENINVNNLDVGGEARDASFRARPIKQGGSSFG